MKRRSMLALLLLLIMANAFASGLSTQQVKCLGQIKDEADFIISRINLIHRSYEKQVKRTALAKFKSGKYSTIGLLDNTIRKYHRKLVKDLKAYPFRYRRQIKSSHGAASKRCLASRLRNSSVGTIHKFELSWRKTLQEAKENASYFQSLEGIQ